MATRRRLANLADVLLRSHLQKKRQDEYGDMIRRRQEELAQQNFSRDVLGNLLKDPKLAYRANQRGVSDVAGYPTDLFYPTPDETLGERTAEIDKISDPMALPTQVGLEGSMSAFPWLNPKDPEQVSRLTGVRDGREKTLLDMLGKQKRAEAVPGAISDIGPEGTERTRYMTPFEAADAGEFQTERTAEQEGGRAADIYSAVTPNAVARERQLEGVRDRSQVLEAQGPNGPGFFSVDPRRPETLQGLSPITAGGAADANASRANSVASLFEDFSKLSSDVNSKEGLAQLATGAYRWGAQLLNQDDVAQMMQTMRKPMGVLLAVIAQGSRPTDRDATSFEVLLPGMTTPAPVAQAMLANVAEILKQSGVENMTLEEVIAAAERGEIQPVGVGRLQQLLTTPRSGAGATPPPGAAPPAAGSPLPPEIQAILDKINRR